MLALHRFVPLVRAAFLLAGGSLASLQRGQLILVFMDILSYLAKEVVSNILKCLHVRGNRPNRCIDLAEGLEHEVLALILKHRHHLRAVSIVLALVFLLGNLQLLKLLIGFLQLA